MEQKNFISSHLWIAKEEAWLLAISIKDMVDAQGMLYHWLIVGHGRRPPNYALINEHFKQHFIRTFTQHTLVGKFILILEVKQVFPVTTLIAPFLIKKYIYMDIYTHTHAMPNKTPWKLFPRSPVRLPHLEKLLHGGLWLWTTRKEHLRMISCSFSQHVPAICRQNIRGHSFNKSFYFTREALYYASVFPADTKTNCSLGQ